MDWVGEVAALDVSRVSAAGLRWDCRTNQGKQGSSRPRLGLAAQLLPGTAHALRHLLLRMHHTFVPCCRCASSIHALGHSSGSIIYLFALLRASRPVPQGCAEQPPTAPPHCCPALQHASAPAAHPRSRCPA